MHGVIVHDGMVHDAMVCVDKGEAVTVGFASGCLGTFC